MGGGRLPIERDTGQLGQPRGVALVLAHQQLGERRADHRGARGALVPEQAREHVGVRRRRLARLVDPATRGERPADQRPGRAEEPAPREAYHQTVESRFSISSTGRV